MKKILNAAYYSLCTLLSIARQIIIIPVAFVHVAVTACTLYIPYAIFFGLRKANDFMDNLVINYFKLFE